MLVSRTIRIVVAGVLTALALAAAGSLDAPSGPAKAADTTWSVPAGQADNDAVNGADAVEGHGPEQAKPLDTTW